MAKKRDKDLFQVLRGSGLRKQVAHALSEAAGQAKPDKQRKLVNQTVDNLRTAASALESRVTGSKRSDAAKKAARTRKRKAAQRSAAARKGAKTRAKRS
jgi:hypothetical protein